LEDHYKEIGTEKDTRPNRMTARHHLTDSSNLIRRATLDIRKYSEMKVDGGIKGKKQQVD